MRFGFSLLRYLFVYWLTESQGVGYLDSGAVPIRREANITG